MGEQSGCLERLTGRGRSGERRGDDEVRREEGGDPGDGLERIGRHIDEDDRFSGVNQRSCFER